MISAEDGSRTPLAAHWDGHVWSTVVLPAGLHQEIAAAGASGPDNVWAVGGGDDGQDSFALHWDGKKWAVAKRWAGAADGIVSGITVLSKSDVWVFGGDRAGHSLGTWHYTGNTWTQIKQTNVLLKRASAISAKNIWAVGYLGDQSNLLTHWNGKTWTATAVRGLPNSPGTSTSFLDVYARSATDLWVVGEISTPGSGEDGPISTPLAVHFDGKSWKRVDPQGTNQDIYRIAPDGSGGVMAIPGVYESPGATPYILHYTGGKWTTEPVSVPAGNEIRVQDLVQVPGNSSAVAVGRTYLDNGMELPQDASIWTHN
jgi:hypothetical protein